MKNRIRIPCVLFLFALLISVYVEKIGTAAEQREIITVQLDQSLTVDVVNAKAVVTRFFFALKNNNLQTIEELLSGALFEKYKRLISDPEYAEFIEERYRDASFEVLDHNIISEGKIVINAKISLNSQESIHMSYLLIDENDPADLISKFRISDERERIDDTDNIPL